MTERPPEAVLWDCLRGALVTKALAVVVDARVPQALADGPKPVSELEGRPDMLHRVLRALASDGIFEEVEPGVFGHTGASQLLLAPAWAAFAHLFGGVFYETVTDLAPDAQPPTFPGRFGADFWSWLQARPDERELFDTAMGGGRQPKAERLAALRWHEGEVVVDVGGGNGALLLGLLERRPELRGVVLDLPETVREDDALALHGIEFAEGSFFESVPAGDAYVLSQVMHDWDDEDAANILRTIHACAPPHARVLITESVIAPGNAPQGAKWLDLLMLVISGGRERTEQEWRRLLESAGLDVVLLEDGLIQARCR